MSKKLSFVLRALFGCAMFLLLFLVLHPREIIAALSLAHLGFFCAGFALCLVGLAGRALRWMLIMRHMGLYVPYWRVLEVYTISYWFNTFMPGSMGGDLYKMYDVSKASAKKIRPAVTVLAERITGVLALLVVAVVALALFHDKVPVPPWLLALILKGAGIVIVIAMIGMLRFEACWSLLSRMFPFVRRFLSAERAQIIGAVCEEMRQKPVLFIEAFILGLCIQVLVLATYYVLALAITKDIPGIYFFTLFPLIEITSLVPITVNGIGIKEGLLVFSLQYAEVGAAFAMGLGILFRIVAIMLAVIGGALLIIRKPSGWTMQMRT